MSQKYFAVVNPGLEEILAQELASFHTRKRTLLEGGVEFEATNRGFYEVLQFSRIANHLYLRLETFKAEDIRVLYKKVRRFEWERLLKEGVGLSFHVSTHRSKLKGRGQIADTVLIAISDRFQKDLNQLAPFKLTTDKEDDISSFFAEENSSSELQTQQRIMIRLEDNKCTLSIDTAGRKMHQRGWRRRAGVAPLRENISFALLSALGWSEDSPLLDPACGSGTFIIEAARKTLSLSPRIWSNYAVESWSNFNQTLWNDVKKSFEDKKKTASLKEYFLKGEDLEIALVRSAIQNANKAQVSEWTLFERGDLRKLQRPKQEKGYMIVNLPYGSRLERQKKAGLFLETALLKQFEQNFNGWILGILLPTDIKLSSDKLLIKELLTFRNGGLPVCFWQISHKG